MSHRLSARLSSNEWSTVGALLDSGDSGNLREGTLPKGSLELRLIRRLEQGWSEVITLRNNGEPRRKVRFQLRFCCPIRDQEFVEEMKKESKLPWKGLVPKKYKTQDALVLRFFRNFGPRKRAPTAELQALYGDRAPKDGEPITRGLDVKFRILSITGT